MDTDVSLDKLRARKYKKHKEWNVSSKSGQTPSEKVTLKP